MTQQSLLPTATTSASSSITPFQFESHAVRVLTDETGEPLFVGKDVCVALGYADHTNAMKQHCRGVVKRHPITDSLGRTQEVRVLSEPDVLRLIVSSHLPEAEKFERWVFEEVLPSIRKTGAYVAPGASADAAPLVGSAQGLVPLSEALALSVERGMTSKAAAGAVLRAASLSLFPGAQAIFDAMRPSRAAPKPAVAAPMLLDLAPASAPDPQPAPVSFLKPRQEDRPGDTLVSRQTLAQLLGVLPDYLTEVLLRHGLLVRSDRVLTPGTSRRRYVLTEKGAAIGFQPALAAPLFWELASQKVLRPLL